ncbi:putative ABC transporter, substrate binding protein [Sulfurimonas gotlandica GD1]|uniref:Putative ABC transporter, substrate binding protein n=1 Tax=Sulfurimonas gotlandica (strain DSM 19862 / JCM 16533 / GD1) TaxID=929558 RepID=B6BGK7_SULGG|nr:PhnD/SsuA/transferrin family substrate-binding protein [Sulfurimonas gotlandica]EDZ63477.1 ABC transporter, substrate-binding protein, putative [Sulfurimonas gotlandica GD1]EHP29634.1 putative ABC transporter, substrate binding protein [Sulfurimonas gotlandica GD1]
MTIFIKKTFILTVFLLLSTTLLSDEKRVIKFAPLPIKKASKNIEDFLPMNYYLKEKLSVDIKYVYKQDYQDILNGFKDGTIDMAYLGPLPFVSLKKEYMFVRPIITFKEKSGSSKYRCVLAKFKNDKFDKEKQIKVALTQPLSTCGYLMTSILLKDNFNIDLENQKYDYTMSHVNALISVVKGEFLIAGAKKSIAKKYESLGIEIIAQSDLLPGFSLVVNTQTLSQQQIKEIEDALLELPQEEYKSWKGITSNGIEKANMQDYDELIADFDIPKKGNMQ